MGKRIIFTGGSGKAGKHAMRYLQDQGHRIVNLDMIAAGIDGILDLKTDITDSGQVFNALSGYSHFDDLDHGRGVLPYDAVVHFAAIPCILRAPDNEIYRVNVMGTYNIIEVRMISVLV